MRFKALFKPLPKLMQASLIGTASLLFLDACASTKIDEAEFYSSLGSKGAVVSYLLSDKVETIDIQAFAKRWADLSDPLTAVRIKTIAAWKGDLEKFCSFTPCSIELQQAVKTLGAKLSKAQGPPVIIKPKD